MLQITVPSCEMFDERTEMFITSKEYTLNLEHSLLSISKWESKYCKPFFNDKNKTTNEFIDYIKCMTLNKNIPDIVYSCLTRNNFKDITNYINHPMTATTIKETKKFSRDIITSEVIYYWMVSFNIPFECEKWHINRLLMLIKVCNAMNNTKNSSRPDMLARHKLNQSRRAKAHSKG